MVEKVSSQPPRGDAPLVWDPPSLKAWAEWAIKQPEPLWLIQDWVPGDSQVIISGQAKTAYKTWLAMALAIAAASGKEVFGFKPTNTAGVPVTFIELEGASKATEERFRMILNAAGLTYADVEKNLRFSHREPIKVDNPVWVDNVSAHINYHQVKLVIVDTLARAHRGDENSARDVATVVDAFDTWSRLDAHPTVMFLHHIRKRPSGSNRDADSIDEDLRGSSALGGMYSAHIGIRHRTGPGQQFLDIETSFKDGQNGKYVGSWTIDQANCTAALRVDPVDGRTGPPEYVTAGNLEALVPGATYPIRNLSKLWGMGTREATTLAEQLVASGKLERSDNGTTSWKLAEG